MRIILKEGKGLDENVYEYFLIIIKIMEKRPSIVSVDFE